MTFMGMSPSKSVSKAGRNSSGKTTFQKILYRGSLFVALLAVILSAVIAAAQEDRPQIMPGERKPAKKKDAGPRAVAVLQLGANGKASLVPIAILINGRFWDASAYKADPVPMALESGTVYEVERAGNSLGLFTVNTALHSNSANVPNPWLGTGAWVPAGSEPQKTALRAEKEPVGIETTDAPPRLTRSGAAPASPSNSQSPGGAPSSSSGSASANQPQSPSKAPSQTNPSQPGSSSSGSTTATSPSSPAATGTNSPPGTSRPDDSKSVPKAEAKPAQTAAMPVSDSGTDESSRPRLRRGKPTAPLPDEDVPGYSKPGMAAPAVTTAAETKTPESAEKSAVELIPAISDAHGPEPKSFGFEWLKDEEGERLKQMTELAKQQVRAYIEARIKAKIVPAAKSAVPRTAGRAASTKPATVKIKDPILENAQMKSYDLWGNNTPVMVLTADAHMPPLPQGAPHSEYDAELQYSITLVANPDIYNNLHKLYVGVTDKFHLDMTPRLELVDAVDADGDGHGELLFKEVSDNGQGWILYRPTADKLWKMFDSLNPE